jgi:predicted regulator of Ras-like GTPase activity (Roadblock/LC7/MglB family)
MSSRFPIGVATKYSVDGVSEGKVGSAAGMLSMIQHGQHSANEKEERQEMLGLFKKILSKSEPAPAAPFAKPARAAAVPSPTPGIAAPPRLVTAVPRPVPISPPTVRPVPAPPGTGTHVHVSLASIASALPESLSHKVPASPEQFVAIPVEKILPQLAHGMVAMTVTELLECAPDYFGALAGNSDLHVTLPLSDLVRQISPEHFTRRTQRRIEIPDEVTSVFAAGISGVTIGKPAPVSAAQSARPSVTAATTSALKPVRAVAAPGATAPSETGTTKIAMSPQALAALGARTASAAPKSSPPSHASPAIGQRASAPVLPKTPALSTTKVATPGSGTKVDGELAVPLGFVCNDWPEEVRAQLAGVIVADAQILVPLDLLQPAMQSGKVLFSWQEVASWIRPHLTIPPTPKVGEMAVELPLKVVAPLFMAHHRAATQQKRVAVDQSIPDLFGGGAKGDSVQAQVAQPSPPAGATKKEFVQAFATRSVAPAKPVPAANRPAPSPARVADVSGTSPAQEGPSPSLESVIGEAGKRLSAKEIVANSARLPGVAGVLLAMTDGLLVTSHTPPQLKAEMIAAFLPQMFGRMNQYTKELALGPLQQLTLGVESGHWNVFKGETTYFAVLGKRGETLPLNLLAQVAAELSSQSK